LEEALLPPEMSIDKSTTIVIQDSKASQHEA